ncbi:hypothetical protein PHLCEN_2v6067, partial [Hermanssonia centrifuga]
MKTRRTTTPAYPINSETTNGETQGVSVGSSQQAVTAAVIGHVFAGLNEEGTADVVSEAGTVHSTMSPCLPAPASPAPPPLLPTTQATPSCTSIIPLPSRPSTPPRASEPLPPPPLTPAKASNTVTSLTASTALQPSPPSTPVKALTGSSPSDSMATTPSTRSTASSSSSMPSTPSTDPLTARMESFREDMLTDANPNVFYLGDPNFDPRTALTWVTCDSVNILVSVE